MRHMIREILSLIHKGTDRATDAKPAQKTPADACEAAADQYMNETQHAARQEECGSDLCWSLDESGLLTVSGTGRITWTEQHFLQKVYPWTPQKDRIRSAVIKSGVTWIGEDCFLACGHLTSVTLPESLTGIGRRAFSNCTALEGMELPDGVTAIGEQAFFNCGKLKSIVIPEGVKQISKFAFSRTGLECITLPSSLIVIEDSAFAHNSLKSIDLPEHLERIGDHAFEGSWRLEAIRVPDSVRSIGYRAFADCRNLKSVTLPRRLQENGGYVFAGCGALGHIGIPEGTTVIGDLLFTDCAQLKTAAIPASVTDIRAYAFTRCPGMACFHVDPENPVYSAMDGCLYSGYEEIGDTAFQGCDRLEEIILPEGLTRIGKRAFAYCQKLARIHVPDTVKTIDQAAFTHCVSLKGIALPHSLEAIGSEAFLDCQALSAVEIPETVSLPRQRNIFLGCSLRLPGFDDPLDAAQQSVEALNDDLAGFSSDYLDACNSSYLFDFEEVDAPEAGDVGKQIDHPGEYFLKIIEDLILNRGVPKDRYTDDVPARMRDRIMETLDSAEAEVFDLSPKGWAKYGIDEDWMAQLAFLVRVPGEREHWFAFWTGWSD